MSKQSDMREKMGWSQNPISCKNCKHYASDIVSIKGTYGYYTKESNKRCLKGGFTTKPLSSCNEHER